MLLGGTEDDILEAERPPALIKLVTQVYTKIFSKFNLIISSDFYVVFCSSHRDFNVQFRVSKVVITIEEIRIGRQVLFISILFINTKYISLYRYELGRVNRNTELITIVIIKLGDYQLFK